MGIGEKVDLEVTFPSSPAAVINWKRSPGLIAFQLPVILALLARVGIASSKGLARTRRYAIVIVFVFAAIFTPPDPISQLTLAVPIIALYEVSILVARSIEKQKAKDKAEQGEDEDDEDEEADESGGALTKS